jgi:hypothetical protein
MSADKSMENTGQEQEQGARKNGGRKSSRKKTSSRGAAAKRTRSAAARRSGASRSSQAAGGTKSRSSSRKSGSGSGSRGFASRFLSSGRKAAGNAYEWAAEGASRAVPLASRAMPDQRMVQRLVDERPYMLGAIGLGIGAMIGLMLPSPLHMGGSTSRSSGRSRR